ncbi:MAG: diguanylate cyclase [Cyanobacteria bacterium]|nr:diguanylate cyclase [Cyanobacteriota bacterium]MDW8200192.1 diguanylate cyclase [Cyanobacteriota bacterium SKYGB_h_bin112]
MDPQAPDIESDRVLAIEASAHDVDEVIFADEEDGTDSNAADLDNNDDAWKILIVDDDPEIHQVTALVISDVTFEQKPMRILSAYNAQEAKQTIADNPDIAVVLLDVIMETDDAGLQVVEYIRHTLGNERTQIILRTGQPGQVPEDSIIRDYEINDYRTKTELTTQKLITSLITGLRVFCALKARDEYTEKLHSFNLTLEQEVRNRTLELELANAREQQKGVQLQQALSELQLLLDISQAINQAPNFEAALAVALERVCEATGWSYGEAWIPTLNYQSSLYRSSIWYCHHQTEPQLVAAVEAFCRQQQHRTLVPGEGLAGLVWQTGQPCWIHNLAAEIDVTNTVAACGFQSGFGVPIVTATSQSSPDSTCVIAVLVFYMADNQPQDHQLVTLVSAMAAQLGTVMQQKQAEAELRALIAAMTDVIIVFDYQGRCLGIAPTGAETLVRPIESLVNQSVHDVLPPDKAEIYLSHIRQALREQRTVNVEYSLKLGNSDIWFLANVSPLTEYTVLWVARDITDLKQVETRLQQANAELQRLATLDGLTQVANRRSFDERLQLEWRRMERDRAPLCLILCDVDYFKRYNDHYGHQAGDDCLRQVAYTIQATVHRASDLVARYGGEEFAVILPNTTAMGGYHVAEAMRQAVQSLNIPHEQSSVANSVTLSAGVASVVPTPNKTTAMLIASADQALYKAKNQGRNQSVCHDLDS